MNYLPPDTERLDGPGLIAWLDEYRRNPYPSEKESGTCRDFLNHDDRRKLRRWRAGHNPSIFEADLLLTQLFVHPSELPDDLFLNDGAKKGVAA